MRLIIDLELNPRSILKLRSIMHTCIDVAFKCSRLETKMLSFTEEDTHGKDTFSIEIDRDCRQAIFSYMTYENAVRRKRRDRKLKLAAAHETDLRD